MVTDKLRSKVMGGATMNDVTSDNHGRITIPVPARPGCYQMKAKRGDVVSSNVFLFDCRGQGSQRDGVCTGPGLGDLSLASITPVRRVLGEE
ncbi:hypothetical protein F5X96DRAFT_622268 [Biscogniauxia mediterranea]|nr:hypothetical protein F5X96DRAFT_622268 [Biscogniauxia mediterranea]